MSKYIRKFSSAVELEAAKSSLPRPCVAWAPDSDEPFYKPYIPGVIEFEDDAVKSILVGSQDPLIDTNGDGEIEISEAAAVTGFGATSIFKANTAITKFNELRYFTKIRAYNGLFFNCTNLEEVTIDSQTTDINPQCTESLKGCSKLKSVTIINLKPSRLNLFLNSCSSLEYVDLSNIDVSECTNFTSMFQYCSKLTTINMSGWDIIDSATGATMLTGSAVRTIIMDGCSDASITKLKSLIQTFATAVGFTIIDNTGTGSVNGPGTYTCAKNSSEWVFTAL